MEAAEQAGQASPLEHVVQHPLVEQPADLGFLTPEGKITLFSDQIAMMVLAAVVGALPLAVASPTPQARAQAALLGMALRFMAALGTGLAVAVAGEFAAVPFLVWLAVSYVALLAVEVGLVVRA